MYTLEGVSRVANFITAYEVSQLNRGSYLLICSVFFVSKGNLFFFFFFFFFYMQILAKSAKFQNAKE